MRDGRWLRSFGFISGIIFISASVDAEGSEGVNLTTYRSHYCIKLLANNKWLLVLLPLYGDHNDDDLLLTR